MPVAPAVRPGANVQLGPGVCLARVPVNGRNFEYLSGEDPFLGFTLVQPVVRGIQSQVIATPLCTCCTSARWQSSPTSRCCLHSVITFPLLSVSSTPDLCMSLLAG
jgi:hypothetical protein